MDLKSELQIFRIELRTSELCKWLRHSHVTASMPSFGTRCVTINQETTKPNYIGISFHSIFSAHLLTHATQNTKQNEWMCIISSV
ncbi:hypothetical protein DVH24_037873 [Malus domestica]|uniref:Uncharacterized protein n=1 Tax=Malus domestica TaxID=3750 RepID=A0A498K303_MALDO|nr:hypothetical protein DVH24_037873 [Malus domestica]